MILIWLIVILLVGGLAAWIAGHYSQSAPRWIALLATAADLALAVGYWLTNYDAIGLASRGSWLVEFNRDWIPQFGISLHLAMDGLSLVLILLSGFLGVLSVATSWTEVKTRVGFFHLNLLWILAGIIGVFVALDLFLFYFFWELMLVPMYLLISIWGHENRTYAATKFFIFTQASGLLMLLAILGLYFVHGKATGIYTFDYTKLVGTPMSQGTGMWLMLGFFIAFAVKLPAVPLHNWLPDAHTEAPTAGSVILAGLLLKTGGYGLIRFVFGLFPDAAIRFAPMAMTLAVIGILYGAIVAFSQSDLKRLVAYTSVSHLGFVLLGVFANNELAYQGAVLEMICHGLSTGGLFMIVGLIQERIHTRDLYKMGGFWDIAPRMGAMGLIFALASLGLPGLGNFVAEFLILFGSYPASPLATILATTGFVFATVYSLWIVQRVFHGPQSTFATRALSDLSKREFAMLAVMVVVLVWLGVYPRPVIDTAAPAHLIQTTAGGP